MDDRTIGAGSVGRGDAEIELARFALELVRRGDDPEGMAAWIQRAAAALIARVSPECRAPTAERLQQIARSLGGIELPGPDAPDRRVSAVPVVGKPTRPLACTPSEGAFGRTDEHRRFSR